MKIRRIHRGGLAMLGTVLMALRAIAAPEADPASVAVVYNKADPASESLAATYAEKRGIPFDRLVGITAPLEETISRAEFDATIAGPLRDAFVERGWWKGGGTPLRVAESSIRFVALMRGVPLRVARLQEPYPGDIPSRFPKPLALNEASVDSELAVLGLGSSQISGPMENPFFKSATPFRDNATLPGLLLVCRLDAPTPATVQRMMGDSLLAEKKGLWGFAYVDSRNLHGGAMGEGDQWFRTIADNALRSGIPCIHEATPALFANGYPMRHAAFYFGWYAPHVTGPFRGDSFRFVPGAVAVHLHSFSATTLRDPLKTWCGPLLERGAAATLGNVYEPYLPFTPNLALFEERLQSGFTFAEAAYAAQPVLSWMTTFIGDPLYRPFKARQKEGGSGPPEWTAYREGARLWYGKDRASGEAFLMKEGKRLKSGVIFEGLSGLQIAARDLDAAIRSLSIAHHAYPDEVDRVRCALSGATLLQATGRKKAALELARRQVAATPKANGAALLRRLITQWDPPPPKDAPPAAPSAPKPQAPPKTR